MNPQIAKTIELIKKSYDQPILFHLLHSHLSHLLINKTPVFEMSDDWSKLLIFSCHQHNTANQGLEIKLQQNLKRYKPPFDNETKLKTMVICYYLLNRPPHLINHILVFELVSNFLGASEYFDGLILRIFTNMLTANIFGLEQNKKAKPDLITKMQEIIKEKHLSNINKVRSLACFVVGDVLPFKLDFIDFSSTFCAFKILEIIYLYAKYTKNTGFIKEVLPDDGLFLFSLEKIMKCEFEFVGDEKIEIEKCVVADYAIFEKIQHEYNRSLNKEQFVSEIIEFVSNLK